jgi:hypothetical protein
MTPAKGPRFESGQNTRGRTKPPISRPKRAAKKPPKKVDFRSAFMIFIPSPLNDHHQRCEPAANKVRIAAGKTAGLASAEWCGWAASQNSPKF